jgi:hypothetical protein
LDESEKQKYSDFDKKVFKEDYLQKSYNLEDRENLKELIKFYSDWLYSPVDEEVENKLYFLDACQSEKSEQILFDKLKENFDKNSKDNSKKLVYGVKIL